MRLVHLIHVLIFQTKILHSKSLMSHILTADFLFIDFCLKPILLLVQAIRGAKVWGLRLWQAIANLLIQSSDMSTIPAKRASAPHYLPILQFIHSLYTLCFVFCCSSRVCLENACRFHLLLISHRFKISNLLILIFFSFCFDFELTITLHFEDYDNIVRHVLFRFTFLIGFCFSF